MLLQSFQMTYFFQEDLSKDGFSLLRFSILKQAGFVCFTSVVDIKGALLIFIFITCINHRGGIFNVRRSPCHPPECFLRLCHGLMSSTSTDGGGTTRRSGLVFLCAPRGALCSSADCQACQNDPPVCNCRGGNINAFTMYRMSCCTCDNSQTLRAEQRLCYDVDYDFPSQWFLCTVDVLKAKSPSVESVLTLIIGCDAKRKKKKKIKIIQSEAANDR